MATPAVGVTSGGIEASKETLPGTPAVGLYARAEVEISDPVAEATTWRQHIRVNGSPTSSGLHRCSSAKELQ